MKLVGIRVGYISGKPIRGSRIHNHACVTEWCFELNANLSIPYYLARSYSANMLMLEGYNVYSTVFAILVKCDDTIDMLKLFSMSLYVFLGSIFSLAEPVGYGWEKIMVWLK